MSRCAKRMCPEWGRGTVFSSTLASAGVKPAHWAVAKEAPERRLLSFTGALCRRNQDA